MAEWVEVVGGSLPPTCMSVLLYIVYLHEDKESMLDEYIITGFYCDEEDKWAYQYVSEDGDEWKYFNENSYLKVVAWTLLPARFNYARYKRWRKRIDVLLFRNKD